jgi:hypothetical protein
MMEALLALAEAGLRGAPSSEVARLEQRYLHELSTYEEVMRL